MHLQNCWKMWWWRITRSCMTFQRHCWSKKVWKEKTEMLYLDHNEECLPWVVHTFGDGSCPFLFYIFISLRGNIASKCGIRCVVDEYVVAHWINYNRAVTGNYLLNYISHHFFSKIFHILFLNNFKSNIVQNLLFRNNEKNWIET